MSICCYSKVSVCHRMIWLFGLYFSFTLFNTFRSCYKNASANSIVHNSRIVFDQQFMATCTRTVSK